MAVEGGVAEEHTEVVCLDLVVEAVMQAVVSGAVDHSFRRKVCLEQVEPTRRCSTRSLPCLLFRSDKHELSMQSFPSRKSEHAGRSEVGGQYTVLVCKHRCSS